MNPFDTPTPQAHVKKLSYKEMNHHLKQEKIFFKLKDCIYRDDAAEFLNTIEHHPNFDFSITPPSVEYCNYLAGSKKSGSLITCMTSAPGCALHYIEHSAHLLELTMFLNDLYRTTYEQIDKEKNAPVILACEKKISGLLEAQFSFSSTDIKKYQDFFHTIFGISNRGFSGVYEETLSLWRKKLMTHNTHHLYEWSENTAPLFPYICSTTDHINEMISHFSESEVLQKLRAACHYHKEKLEARQTLDHLDTFTMIEDQIAIILEKNRLHSDLKITPLFKESKESKKVSQFKI